MRLEKLIEEIDITAVHGEPDREIAGVTFDSREVTRDSLFIAVRGLEADGHQFIPVSVAQGATAIVCEELPSELRDEITYIVTGNARKAVALIAACWYGHPSRELHLVGITGTNGKTTIATLLYKVNTGLGYRAGILSTNGIIVGDRKYPATHTTPDALQINQWLREMVDSGCQYCFMEVSSHAASQNRIDGLRFRGGVFTNLTQDHMDYHKDFRAYLEAKKYFFDQLDERAFALTNADDRNGRVMIQNSRAQKYSYGLNRMTDFSGKVLEQHFEGMRLKVAGTEVWARLTGRFNAYNIMAVYGVSVLLGHQHTEVLEEISKATSAEGRFEIIKGSEGTIAIVDYAHTEDALKNVLETIREVNSEGREIITVVGAGGDRDTTKRPKMGAVAIKYSNRVILTSDNPRSEDPAAIMAEMEKGMPSERTRDVLKITDREEAIKTACMLAGAAAVILVAGKGHEKYQDIGGERKDFDDSQVIKKYIK